ncbi:MAG: DUF2256 and DUF3253 domain-containing protein [Acidimicrobiia bacterium]|nr:DUF2256 and DUF3253 domain-containing protein [Acidimicrobiia bacterium]
MANRSHPEPKTCSTCGRTIEWRRKWADDWDQVRYCSQRCRRSRPGPVDRALEAAIVELLAARPASSTVCPSEAARRVATAGDDGADDADRHGNDEGWRDVMEPARAAARRLVADGQVVIKQRGRMVDPSTAKGPIRLAPGPGLGRPTDPIPSGQ